MKLDINLAESLPEELARPQDLDQVLRLLLAAFEFVHIGAFLQYAVITDVDRNKGHILAGTVFICIQQHGKKSQFGQHQFAGAAAGSFDKKLDVESFLQQFLQVFGEYLCIQHRSAKGPAYEEGTAPAENGAQRPEGQILAGGDMRTGQVVVVKNVREDQVVDMAFVTGNEDQRRFLRSRFNVSETLGVDDHAVEHRVADVIDGHRSGFDQSRAVLGGDFLQVAVRFFANCLDGYLAGIGVLFHELAEAVVGENTFLEFLQGL